MKTMRRVFALRVFFCLAFLVCVYAPAYAEVGTIEFEKGIEYDVSYEVSDFEVDTVERVVLAGIGSISDKKFLIVKGTFFNGKETEGYILLDKVKALLPSGHMKPKKTLGSAD